MATEMRLVGVGVDKQRAEELYQEAHEEAEKLAESFAGINLRSPNQVAKLLYEDWGLPIKERSPKTGKPSTKAKVLEQLTYHEGVADIIAARKLFKAMGAFYLPLIDRVTPKGRVHAGWSPSRAESHRWTCNGPNLMTKPRRNDEPADKAEELLARVGDVFVARPGYVLVHADLPSAELRITAILSREPKWMEWLSEGKDMHTMMAQSAGISRHAGKTQNYQNLYGAGYKKLALTLGYATGKPFPLDEAKRMWHAYWAAIPRVRRLFDGLAEAWMRRGKLPIKPWPGIYRHRWNEMMQHPEPEFKALNAVVQCTIAQLVNDWLLFMRPEVKAKNGFIVAQCHDAVTLEVPEEHVEWAKWFLQHAFDTINTGRFDSLPWPLEIEVGIF